MFKMKKMLALLLTLVMSTALLAGCGESQDSKKEESNNSDVIKIGAMTPQTGEYAVYGKAALNGYKLAVKQYNEKDGVLGKKVDLISYDDKGDDNEAVNAYNRLIDNDNVDGIIGAVMSTNTSAIASLAAREGIPMITATGTAEDITLAGDNVFRSCFTDPFQGNKVAKFATEDLKAKTAAVVYNTSSDYSEGLAEAFKETFEKSGGKIVSYEGYAKDDKDFKSILTNIKAKNPDVLLIPDYYETIALVTKQAREVGLESTFLGGDGWDGVIGKVDNKVIENSYFTNHYALDDPSELVQNFIKSYEAEYGEKPNAFAALGYDAATTLLEAIKKAGSTDKDKVVEAMKNTDLDLVSGHTKFDKNRNPIKEVSIIKIIGGENKLETKK